MVERKVSAGPGRKLPRIVVHVVLAITGVLYFFPFYWLIASSLKASAELYVFPPTLVPQTLTLANYLRVFQVLDVGLIYWNTLRITAVAVFSTVVLGAVAGYCFEKLRFPGRELFFSAILFTMIIPFEGQMVPLYLLMDRFRLVNTHAAVILPNLLSGFAVFFFRQNIKAIPDDLLDAARIDGVSVPGRLLKVVLPLLTTAVATIAIFTFVGNWTNFLWPFIIINSQRLFTIEMGMAIFTNSLETVEEGARMAGAAIAIVPMIVFFLAAQRYFLKGVALSGLKG
jgi:multiple sugar transport system permease protein